MASQCREPSSKIHTNRREAVQAEGEEERKIEKKGATGRARLHLSWKKLHFYLMYPSPLETPYASYTKKTKKSCVSN